MHLLLPFAGASSPALAEALGSLRLPNLEALLARLQPQAREQAEPTALTPPAERALARALGWPALPDGLLPWAAEQARRAGLKVEAGQGWALIHPTHWQVGSEQIAVFDPAQLELQPPEARALFEAAQPLFDADGQALHWLAPTRWLLRDDALLALPTAALDKVVGRHVDPWLDPGVHAGAAPALHPAARRLRRLQAEVQMLWHTDPVNEAREARGLPPVNSFWIDGTGPAQPATAAPWPQVDAALRRAALADDAAAWAQAWAALEAGPLAECRRAAEAGRPVALTLAGERAAQTFAPATPRPWWRRWGPKPPAATAWLKDL